MNSRPFKFFRFFFTIWAASIIAVGALLCTLLVKLYWAIHINQLSQYLSWIAADVFVLATIELLCVLVCFFWRRRWAARSALVFAAMVCTWSVINAGWIIATGTQALPAVLTPLFFDPISRFIIIGYNLAARPLAAFALLGPSAIALMFFFRVLAKPLVPRLTKRYIRVRLIIYIILVISFAVAAKIRQPKVETEVFAELRYNSQLKAIRSIFVNIRQNQEEEAATEQIRKIPLAGENPSLFQDCDSVDKFNIILVVLEGISPGQTNLFDKDGANVPFLAELADSGASFTNCRTIATHTTKALFSIHTGRYPSVNQDYVEAAVKNKPYQSIATILKNCGGYRTAFFQSAAGTFEARPGLVNNLGFDDFFAREDIPDANSYLGYLAADEFFLIEPICRWIQQSEKPFMISILGSAAHDPYEVPAWYEPANGTRDKPVKKYRKVIEYTDSFLAKLYERLAQVTDREKMIFCVIGDHGEAFGQHGRYGHARVPYEEALKIFWFIKSPQLINPPVKIDSLLGGIDVTPTLLGLLGFDIKKGNFDGINALKANTAERKLFFSTWTNNGSAGFITKQQKFIYDATNEMVIKFDLTEDPDELKGKFILRKQSEDQKPVISQVTKWQREVSIELQPDGTEKYQRIFDNWLCQTNNRKPRAVYDKQ